SLASRLAQLALDSGYFVFVGRGRRNALSFKKRIEFADLLLNLLFLDLIADQCHLQRGRIFCSRASCHAYSPGQEYLHETAYTASQSSDSQSEREYRRLYRYWITC